MSDRPAPEPLARTAHQLAAEWELELGPPYALSNYSFVAPAGERAVLKVSAAGDDESEQESDALRLWDGNGAVRLLRSDARRRALLIERAQPGTDISALPDDEATAIAIGTARRLWRPAGAPFRWIGDFVSGWLERAEQRTPAGGRLIERALELHASLEPGRSWLVHGDLHHHNILDAGDRHAAIDPKPMLGEPEYDIPSFLWNPVDREISAELVRRRLAAFAAAGLDEPRMRAWTAIRGAYLCTDENDVEIILSLVS